MGVERCRVPMWRFAAQRVVVEVELVGVGGLVSAYSPGCAAKPC